MDGQLSFATLDYVGRKKRTKRDVLLVEMAAAVPWSVLEAVIAPHYPKEGPQGEIRRRVLKAVVGPFPIAMILRIYCLQQWYNLSDPARKRLRKEIRPCHLAGHVVERHRHGSSFVRNAAGEP